MPTAPKNGGNITMARATGSNTVELVSGKAVSNINEHLAGMMGDAPLCSCGHVTVRSGSCYKCLNCGNSLGCS